MTHQLEILCTEQRRNITLGSGIEIVDAQHVVFLAHETAAQMRAQKPGSAGDQDSFVPHSTAPNTNVGTLATLAAGVGSTGTKHHSAEDSNAEYVHPPVSELDQRRIEKAGNDVLRHERGPEPRR